MLGLGYFLKVFVFERESYFWKKRTIMLTFKFDFQNCQKFVPSLAETSLLSKITGCATANKKARCSQASISINSCTELSKTQFFPVNIVKLEIHTL